MDKCDMCTSGEIFSRKCVKCYYCKRKYHSDCVGMTEEEQRLFSNSKMRFACKKCAFNGDTYDASAALIR